MTTKKLRWHDQCDLADIAISEDRLVKKFISCALCPKCFIHLADLQEHHDAYHGSVNVNNSHRLSDSHYRRSLQKRQDFHNCDDDSSSDPIEDATSSENTNEIDEDSNTSDDEWHPCRSSTTNNRKNATYSDPINYHNSSSSVTRRSNLKTSCENLVSSCVPSTPSPRPTAKFFRCNTCLELFDTNAKLQMHKTMNDHHEFNCYGGATNELKHRYNAKSISQSFASQKMQSQIESFLAEKKFAKKIHIGVRVVHASKKSFEVSSFVQKLFKLTTPRIECNAKTIFLFERFGNVDVIVFALFVQEYGDDPVACPAIANRRRIFVSHFGAPGFLQGVNDELHAELFCQFLLSYLTYATSLGFEQIYFSSRMMADCQQDAGIFNCQNVIRFRTEWLLSVFNDARTKQLSYVGNFQTLADYRHFCRDTNEDERRFPLFIFDDDEDEWSLKIERSAVDLLRKRRNEWIEMDKSASRDAETRTMADVLMYDLVAGNRFVVVNLQPPNSKKGQPLVVDADEEDDFFYLKRPGFLSSPRRFLEKCRRRGWQFDTLQQAANSTASIISKITAFASKKK